MQVNGVKYDVDSLLNEVVQNDMLQKHGNLFLSGREVSILKTNHIEYEKASSLEDLRLIIEDFLEYEDDDNDDLDWVLGQISERNYYININK